MVAVIGTAASRVHSHYHEYSRLDEYGNVESNYVYDIELNISNTDNTTGYIFFGRYLFGRQIPDAFL